MLKRKITALFGRIYFGSIPYTHNLSKLLRESGVNLTSEQVLFYSDMNLFQAKGRYPETIKAIENKVTVEIHHKYNNQLNSELEWLINLLQ